jgi:hypothetical protein
MSRKVSEKECGPKNGGRSEENYTYKYPTQEEVISFNIRESKKMK